MNAQVWSSDFITFGPTTAGYLRAAASATINVRREMRIRRMTTRYGSPRQLCPAAGSILQRPAQSDFARIILTLTSPAPKSGFLSCLVSPDRPLRRTKSLRNQGKAFYS